VAWDVGSGAAVGIGRIWVCLDFESRHLAGFHIEVLPAFRLQGIGRRLVARVARVAREADRTALTAWSYIPAGEPFMRRIGAEVGQTERTSQLELSDLDPKRVRASIERAAERASGFELELWEEGYPEAALEEAAAMQAAMNFAPRGSMPQADLVYTAEDLRQENAALRERRVQLSTLVARERSTRAVAGFTQIYRDPAHPDLLGQGDTGVFPLYRNRGIGRWLKAAMLEEVIRRYPEARRIRTTNAKENAAMLKINTELGFRPHHSVTGWHITVERLDAYLAASR
jgi:GNAT superfamily N-acetyltransferase